MSECPQAQSHVRLTPMDVKRMFEAGYIKPTGYVYLLLSSMKQHGWQHTIKSIPEFCEEWGIAERTFYRSKAKLIADGFLSEQIPGEINLFTKKLTGQVSGLPLPKVAEPLPKVAEPLPKVAEPLPKVAEPLPKVAEEHHQNPYPESDAENPQIYSDLDQIYNNSYSLFTSYTEQQEPVIENDSFGQEKKESSVQKFEKRFRQGLNEPWRTGSGINDFDEAFCEWLSAQWKQDTLSNAKAFLRNAGDDFSKNKNALGYWEDYQLSKKPRKRVDLELSLSRYSIYQELPDWYTAQFGKQFLTELTQAEKWDLVSMLEKRHAA